MAYSGTIFTLLKHQIDLAWQYSKQKDMIITLELLNFMW